MVAVDLSGSMQATDFTQTDGSRINRLQAVKLVLNELAQQRQKDRLGLLVFGSAPYLQVPFTEDHATWRVLLEETEIGMAGQSTVFGDAIGLAIHLFEDSTTENRVLIMLTDGNDTGSTVPPVEAAKVAQAYGIRIYTIAIGDPATVGEEKLDEACRAQFGGDEEFVAVMSVQGIQDLSERMPDCIPEKLYVIMADVLTFFVVQSESDFGTDQLREVGDGEIV